MSDEQELTERLSHEPSFPLGRRDERTLGMNAPLNAVPTEPTATIRLSGLVQWTNDGPRFMPAPRTVQTLPCSLYEIDSDPRIGIFFRQIPTRTEGLLRLPHTNSDVVVAEIARFWTRKDAFSLYGLPHKRGILLWGPPGSGKSSTIQLVMQDVIQRGGIGIVFGHPGLFIEGIRMLREIQPETPIVVLMEDLDSIIREYSETTVLNLLDGAEKIDGVVFLASTNYPELLGARIVNRPSRFDRRLKIGHPSSESRRAYLKHIIRSDGTDVDVDRWVKDTDGLSLAHLKELLVAVAILGSDYEETVERLRSMREAPTSSERGSVGIVPGVAQ